MGLPLAENGIFPSLTSPEVGVTPSFSRFARPHYSRFALDTFSTPLSFFLDPPLPRASSTRPSCSPNRYKSENSA